MKTVAKINPEKEYENAKRLIALASSERIFNSDTTSSLDKSVDNLITATRVLIEREERRRGYRPSEPKITGKKGRNKGEERKEAKKLPSERYPNLEVLEEIVHPKVLPQCPCCRTEMKESGLFDTSEKLEVVPKRYYIQRQLRPKYRCNRCHGGMLNTTSVPSIVPTSNYGDSVVIDAALSKYCDLIPFERYVQIAERGGLEDLPAQSLIGLSHHLANFLQGVYEKIKQEVMASIVLQADETPHRMLEGDDKKQWYLWGFFSSTSCFFEVHNTRSGDVVFQVLKNSDAKFLVTDGFSGYGKAIKDVKEKLNKEIVEVHCNAHAYRYFEEASVRWGEETKSFLENYGEIYSLELKKKEIEKELANEEASTIRAEQLKLRMKMMPYFEIIREDCTKQVETCMRSSALENAIKYFLNHYAGLTRCTENVDLPLDNNLSERELRAPVIGRKTWIGTHSKRGALTGAVLFSIVHACKLNKINPRNYFPWVVRQIHQKKEILTPYEYSLLSLSG